MVGNIGATPVDTYTSPTANVAPDGTTMANMTDDIDLDFFESQMQQPVTGGSIPPGEEGGPGYIEPPTPDNVIAEANIPDYLDNITLTSAQAPVEQAPPGIMNPYDPSQSTVLGQPGIDRLDTSEVDIGVDNTVDYGMPQGSPGQLNPALPSINNISESLDAPYGVNPNTGIPYQEPRTIADQNRVLGIVTEEDVANPKGLLEKIGLGNLDIKKTAVMAAINKAVGAPVSLLISALQALPQYEPTFEERILEEELGVTEDGKFSGDPTESAFAGLNAVSAYGDPVETAKNRIETRLET